ncbi:MAG: hypothetical protein ABI663_23975 [Chryseolinea sp.]
MVTTKKLGIWMDHSNAHLIEFSTDDGYEEKRVIASKFTHSAKESSLGKNENLMHNKERHQQSEYYKELGVVIRNYESVILFGPTDAKSELLNTLKSDHNFSKIKVEIKNTDKMTDNQEQAFVREYFTKHL